MEKFNYMVGITFILFLFMTMITSCSFIIDKDRNDKIKIENLEPIVQETKVNCDSDRLKELEIAKCKMNARLMEIRY